MRTAVGVALFLLIARGLHSQSGENVLIAASDKHETTSRALLNETGVLGTIPSEAAPQTIEASPR